MAEKLEGAFGAPPAHAPRETTAPLNDSALAEQLARAAANEKTLPPFNPQPDAVVELTQEPPVNAASALLAAVKERQETAPQTYQPAASNTDSPSRGIPQPIADPGKRITGGFGDAGEAQYFALDGAELRELVKHLLGKLAVRMDDDLRFHVAITYPRIKVELILKVTGYGQQEGFEIRSAEVKDQTPVEVAELFGATPVAFELTEMRREFDEQDQPENPPDRLRDEVGMEKPRKQAIETAGGRILVDRPTSLGGSF